MVSCSVFLPPQWYGSPGSTPFPSICELMAAFLRSSLVFARSLQHFWLPASHLLGTCYLLDDLRSTHSQVPTCYLRATYSHIYIYMLCIYFLFTTYIYIHNIYIHVFIYIYTHIHRYTYVCVYIYIYKYNVCIYIYAPAFQTPPTVSHPHHTTGTGGEADTITTLQGGGGQYYGWPMTMSRGGLERWTICNVYIYIYIYIYLSILNPLNPQFPIAMQTKPEQLGLQGFRLVEVGGLQAVHILHVFRKKKTGKSWDSWGFRGI